jgi:DNA-binding NtrC family response regulator
MESKALASQSTKKRILAVDDEPDITLTLKLGLEVNGRFNVDTFNDPELVLQSFRPSLYSLVLIDIKMPKMSGFELYELLKKIDPDVKVCFLTGTEMYHQEVREKDHCAFNRDLFLQKPISNEDLVIEIAKKIKENECV